MDLREYLFHNRLTQKEMSKRLGISKKYMCDIVHGKHRPSMRLARDIEVETKGEIKAIDLVCPPMSKKIA